MIDEVIDYIKSTGLNYYVGPCETSIEGDYDTLMEIVKNCQLVAAKAGCKAMNTYVKISYKAEGDVLTIDKKVTKLTSKLPAAVALCLLILLWQFLYQSGVVPAYMLPSPVQVVKASFYRSAYNFKTCSCYITGSLLRIMYRCCTGICYGNINGSFSHTE